MLTDAHMGEGGVKICSNHAHVVYGRSLCIVSIPVEIEVHTVPHSKTHLGPSINYVSMI